jgi:4'-phosphopantetheinyl transferase
VQEFYYRELNNYEKLSDIKDTFIRDSVQSFCKKQKKIRKSKFHTAKTEKGKPFFPDCPNIHFSLSHSNKIIIIIFSDFDIGIDIEDLKFRKESMEKLKKISKRFFHSDEIKILDNAENFIKTFYEIWTKKESYLKLIGEGIPFGLNKFSVFSLNNIKFQKINLGRNYICHYAKLV